MELFVHFALASTLLKVTYCQTVAVMVPNVYGEYGSETRLSCDFSVFPSAGYTFRELKWSKDTSEIANFLVGVPNPIYGTGYTPQQYPATSTESDSNLTISDVKYEDAGSYKCEAVFLDGSTLARVTGEDFGNLTVYVPPTNLTITYDGEAYTNGASFPVVAGNGRQFTCTATGITPEATFAWSLSDGSTNLPIGTPTQTDTPTTAPLMNSASTITVDIPETPETFKLECQAYNTPDGSDGASIAVTLQVREVEQPSSGLGTGAIAGIAAGGAAVVIVIGGGGIFCWYKKKHQ